MKVHTCLTASGCLALVFAVVGCEGGEGETMRFHHGSDQYVLSYDRTPQGIVVREGPDNTAVERLLTAPQSGYAPDPLEPRTLWIYLSEQEREEIRRSFTERAAKNRPARAASDSVQADCEQEPSVTLFRDRNLGGQAACGLRQQDAVDALGEKEIEVARFLVEIVVAAGEQQGVSARLRGVFDPAHDLWPERVGDVRRDHADGARLLRREAARDEVGLIAQTLDRRLDPPFEARADVRRAVDGRGHGGDRHARGAGDVVDIGHRSKRSVTGDERSSKALRWRLTSAA